MTLLPNKTKNFTTSKKKHKYKNFRPLMTSQPREKTLNFSGPIEPILNFLQKSVNEKLLDTYFTKVF